MKDLLPTLGFPADKTQVLLDREATKARIEWVLYNDFRHMGSEDRLIVYFAGHGETNPLRHGEEGYILPVDADADALPATAIAMADLRKIGQRLKGKHFLFIMDACFSGFALTRSGPGRGSADPYLENALKEPAVQVLTAGRKGEKAVEQGGHGLFTRRLLEGLRGEADTDNQGFVTAAQLFSWIQPRVARESRGGMNPQFGTLDGEGQFIFFLPKSAPAPERRPPPLPGPPEPREIRSVEEERRLTEEKTALVEGRRRLEEERALLEERIRSDDERRAIEEQRRRLPPPPQVAAVPPPSEKVPVLLSTSGHGYASGLQSLLSLGLFTSEYAIEIDGTLMVDWRIRSVEEQLSLTPGPHKIRILRRYTTVKTPVLLYEGPLLVQGPKNEVSIDFAGGTVSVNGKMTRFIPEK